ncbi:MAG: DUF454 family protein, partial [Psychrobacter sp.]|nr:DUF454 family protein [Psychrobacter sp.]
YVRDWEDRRAVPLYAKWLATIMMTISTIMLFFNIPADMIWVAWLLAVVCTSVAVFLFRLPNA